MLYTNSYNVRFLDFDIEIVPSGASARPDLLDSLRDEVLEIAAISRGWTDDSEQEGFRRHFKIGPLYEASSLALIRKDTRLVGLVGAVNDWRVADMSLVHLCSLNLLPAAQARGLMQALMALLWQFCWGVEQISTDYQQGRVYVTAITQSPYLIAYLDRLFETYPSPHRQPTNAVRHIAEEVVARFDPHIPLEPNTLILRNEAQFFYRKIPYSTNRDINAFCDQHLRYGEGDVFVVVGRVIPDRIARYVNVMSRRYPDFFQMASTLPGVRSRASD